MRLIASSASLAVATPTGFLLRHDQHMPHRNAACSARSIQDQTYRDIEIVILDDGFRNENVATIRKTLQASPFPDTLTDQENTGSRGRSEMRWR
jgi:hypothetical protein